jgi:ankyrin repeat protein
MSLSLQEAIWAGDLDQVVAALDRGADPNAMDVRGNSPLVIAAIEGHTAIADILLTRGADPNKGGSDGFALQWAIIRGNVPMAHALLNSGVDATWRDLQNASERHVVTVVEAILDRGVNVNGHTQDGRTALMSAAFVGDAAATRLLLDRDAEVNARTVTGWAAVLSAAAKGHAEVVRLLLDAGADITVQDKDGDSALSLAMDGGHQDVIALLRKAGATE